MGGREGLAASVPDGFYKPCRNLVDKWVVTRPVLCKAPSRCMEHRNISLIEFCSCSGTTSATVTDTPKPMLKKGGG